jgi:replicative DNA helicase
MPYVYNKKRIYFYISRRKGEQTNHITDCLRRAGVYDNKHIPDNYLYNNRKNRLKLLAGIIDSDGHYSKKSNMFTITMTREKLVKQIHTLAQGLGFYSNYTECETSMQRADGTCYKGEGFKVTISGEITCIPTKVKRKKSRLRKSTRNYLTSG